MNQHLNDGQLRAGLDGELNPSQLGHLESCGECQRRQAHIQAQILQASRRLAFLAPEEDMPFLPPGWPCPASKNKP